MVVVGILDLVPGYEVSFLMSSSLLYVIQNKISWVQVLRSDVNLHDPEFGPQVHTEEAFNGPPNIKKLAIMT